MSERSGLPDDVRTAIVQALACYETPSDVVRLVKDGFGVEVSRQAVEAYDPTKRAGHGLSAANRAIFDATRERYFAEAGKVGIVHPAVRLRNLQRLADKAEGMGNVALAARIMEQAAREAGGFYAAPTHLSWVRFPQPYRARGAEFRHQYACERAGPAAKVARSSGRAPGRGRFPARFPAPTRARPVETGGEVSARFQAPTCGDETQPVDDGVGADGRK